MSTVILGTKSPNSHDRRLDAIWDENDVRYRICIRCGIHSNDTFKGRCRDCRSIECGKGHLLTPENTYGYTKRGGRLPECRACHIEKDRVASEKAKAPACS